MSDPRQPTTHTPAGMRAGGVGLDGMKAFLTAFFAAPNDADVEFRIGARADAPLRPLLLVMVEHPTMRPVTVGLSASEARGMAEIAEDTMRRFADTQEAKALPNLIMGLRMGADKLEEP